MLRPLKRWRAAGDVRSVAKGGDRESRATLAASAIAIKTVAAINAMSSSDRAA
jgi:hypothetical protein